MNPKHKPRPITSFVEDEFELDAVKKAMSDAVVKRQRIESETRQKYGIIAVVRIIIAIVAFLLAIWLYILVDDFISYRRYQQLRPGVRVSYVPRMAITRQ